MLAKSRTKLAKLKVSILALLPEAKSGLLQLKTIGAIKLLDVNYFKFHHHAVILIREERGEQKKVISRDCDGCEQQKICIRRFNKVSEGEKVYCPDGTAHLVDNASQA